MEAQTLIFSFLFIFLSFMFLFRRKKLNLPPSPANWLPVVGHLRLLKLPLHRSFISISESLGGAPVFSLRLGNRLMFVVSSYSIAEECFTKNDVVLANRPNSIFGKHVGYNYTCMVVSSYGEHWRNLRRICAAEIFSSERFNSFSYIRKEEIRRLILRLSKHSLRKFAKVEIKPMLYDLTFNNIMRMLTGEIYCGDGMDDNVEAKYVRDLLTEAASVSGAGNYADYIPMLRCVNNFENQMKNLAGRVDSFLQGLIDKNRGKNEKGNTTLDQLLSLQETEPEYYSDNVIKGLLLVLIVGATDTSTATLEWTLSNLLNHPEILNKARTEIDNKVGLDRLMDERDISNLPYLQNILFETLRLYPPGPLLLPHMSSEDCKVAGYDMPRGTTLLVNVWAIHRDPKIWEEPLSFKPERFEKEGEDKKLMTFGLGRRACPGVAMAQRILALALGSLIQCYEWKTFDNKDVDMTEGNGNSMNKATPLEAMLKARPIITKILDDGNL